MARAKKAETTKAVEKAITWKHSGKMEDMVSLSTSPVLNRHCMERAKNPNTICSACYSMHLNSLRKTLREKLARNTELLTAAVIPVDEMPTLNVMYFRFEAFGDLQNTVQIQNYFNLCTKNPETRFALWTKNPFIIRQALAEGAEKPSNLIIIYSSPIVNKPAALEALRIVFPFVDKVFTVYDKKHAENVNINCGARHCRTCLQCYRNDTAEEIRELLK